MNKNRTKTNSKLSDRAPIHPMTLSFDSTELQQDYVKYHIQRSLKLMRLALIMGMVLYLLYSYLDRIIVPHTASKIFMIRISVGLLFLLVIFISLTKLINENGDRNWR